MKTYLFFNSTAASSPGRVDVKVQTSDGQYLGSTVFTYVDEDQEVFRRFITSDRLQSKFFSFLAQELAIRKSKPEQDETSKCSSECLDSWYVWVNTKIWCQTIIFLSSVNDIKQSKETKNTTYKYWWLLKTDYDAGVICNVLLTLRYSQLNRGVRYLSRGAL